MVFTRNMPNSENREGIKLRGAYQFSPPSRRPPRISIQRRLCGGRENHRGQPLTRDIVMRATMQLIENTVYYAIEKHYCLVSTADPYGFFLH
jgi:hypothetical protein